MLREEKNQRKRESGRKMEARLLEVIKDMEEIRRTLKEMEGKLYLIGKEKANLEKRIEKL